MAKGIMSLYFSVLLLLGEYLQYTKQEQAFLVHQEKDT